GHVPRRGATERPRAAGTVSAFTLRSATSVRYPTGLPPTNTVPSSAANRAVRKAPRSSREAPSSSSRPRVAASAASASTGKRGGSSEVITSPSGVTMSPPRTPSTRINSKSVSRKAWAREGRGGPDSRRSDGAARSAIGSGPDVQAGPQPAHLDQPGRHVDVVRKRHPQDRASVAPQKRHLGGALDDPTAQSAQTRAGERGRGDAIDLGHVQRKLTLALVGPLREYEAAIGVRQHEVTRALGQPQPLGRDRAH